MKQRAGLYIRVSTPEQAREGYSVGEQEERLKALAVAREWQVVKVYVDPGETGANTNRPGLQKLMEDVRSGLLDLVVVYKLDRLSRSQKDTLHLIEDVFLPNGVNFASLSENLDTSTPSGRMMIGILSAFAQLEREQIRERSIMGKEARAKSGLWHGGGNNVPTGYDYVDGQLVVNEYEASALRYAAEEVRKGLGVRTAFRRASAKFPGVFGHETTLRQALRNDLFIGYVTYRGKQYPGRHQPILEEDQFHEIQEILRKRATLIPDSRHPYLLTGLLYCGRCGARMHGRGGAKNKDGFYRRYYVCYSRSGVKPHLKTCDKCDLPNIPVDKLDDRIIDIIKRTAIKEYEEGNKEKGNDQSRKASLEGELAKVEGRIGRLVDLYAEDVMPMETIKKKMEELKKQKEALELEIQQSEKASDKKDVQGIIDQLRGFDWDGEQVETKRVLMAQLVDRIEVFGREDGDELRVTLAI